MDRRKINYMNIESVIASHLDIDISQVTDDAHLINDLGADSLHVVELIIAFENEYGLEIPDEDAEQLDTVGKIKQYLSNKKEHLKEENQNNNG